ncbi:serine--tRNA ligase [candidate division KSB1 bacterium]|nr:serine--tRNA ligase [candidate division KSB1 bacterium]
MLDLKFIRKYPNLVQQGAERKNIQIDLDKLLELDQNRRELQTSLESHLQQKKTISRQINFIKENSTALENLKTESHQLNSLIDSLEGQIKALDQEIHLRLIQIPNLPHASVPDGQTESENQIIKYQGKPVETDFQILPHWEIAEKLGIIDFERSSQLAGAFFVTFKGAGARLERALINFMLDLHVKAHGYTEICPPFITRRQALFGTGQLPRLENDMYCLERDDFFLIPTAEVPLTNFHQNEIFTAEELPIKYVAYTPCFRREAGTHGRENRGLIRIHQFDKVELVQLVKPEESYQTLEILCQQAEKVLQLLELPYRVNLLCAGELSFASAKCYDLEVWSPGIDRYLEVSSCCNFEAFQARRINLRYRPDAGKKVEFVHTLNASGLALPRTFAAILENYQTDEGTIIIPTVLRPYTGFSIIK